MKLVKKDTDKVIGLLIYKNLYVLIKNLHVFLGKRDSKFACTRCLRSYSSQNVLIKQKQRCEQQEKTAIKTSNESHLFRKKYFSEESTIFQDLRRF